MQWLDKCGINGYGCCVWRWCFQPGTDVSTNSWLCKLGPRPYGSCDGSHCVAADRTLAKVAESVTFTRRHDLFFLARGRLFFIARSHLCENYSHIKVQTGSSMFDCVAVERTSLYPRCVGESKWKENPISARLLFTIQWNKWWSIMWTDRLFADVTWYISSHHTQP